jgi:hypothetical protein
MNVHGYCLAFSTETGAAGAGTETRTVAGPKAL